MDNLKRSILLAAAVVLLLAVLAWGPEGLGAQEPGAIGRQTLGRPYVHVFVAYAIAWILIFGWLVSVGRRLRRVEERLEK